MLSSPAPHWRQAVWGRRLLPPAAQPEHPAAARQATHRWLASAESQFNPIIRPAHSPVSLFGDLHTPGERPPLGTSQAGSGHCLSSRSWWRGPTGGALPAWSRWNKSTWESWCWSSCYGSSCSQLWSSQNISKMSLSLLLFSRTHRRHPVSTQQGRLREARFLPLSPSTHIAE